MVLQAHTELSAQIWPLSSAAELRNEWLELEASVKPAVFRRWLWIGTWLETYRPELFAVRISAHNETIALGLFSAKAESRRGWLRSRRLRLHQTGIPAQDQIWIEYNGLLARPEHQAACLHLATRTLLETGHGDEAHLSMLDEEAASAFLRNTPQARESLRTTGYLRDLGKLRTRGVDVLDALSANTRHQIRRSLRGYTARYGKPRIEAAASVHDALAAFHEAGHWHKQRWPDSGFNNPAFTAFHETLIKRGFDHSNARLYRVMAGDHPVGVFFYLCSGDRAYFYLQGVAPEPDGKLKPGLMSHALLMQHFMEQGYSHYDFMGGHSQYKQQLADETTTFMMIDLHNGALRFRLEDGARRLYRRWQSLTGRQAA